MSFSAGDTLYNRATERVPSYLWVIVSDPTGFPDQVVMANITSWNDLRGDAACRLKPGDHPFITNDSFVNYEDAVMTSVRRLEDGQSAKLFERRAPVSNDLLERIRQGLMLSEFCPNKFKRVLSDQGLA